MQATGRVRFSFRFLFASHRDTDWNATRANFVLGKNGYNYCLRRVSAKIASKSIDRFKKKRNLNPHSTTLYLSKRVQNRSKRIPRCVLRTFAWIYSEYDFARRNTRAEKRGSFASVVFVFFENAILVSIWRHVWTRFFKKRKKELTPLPPLSLTQKILSMTHNNNRLSSEVTARSPRRN